MYKTGIHWNKDWNQIFYRNYIQSWFRIRPESTEIRIETYHVSF